MSRTPADSTAFTRRDFIGLAAFGAFGAALLALAGAGVRYAVPRVSNEPSTRVRIGRPENFPPGTVTKLDAGRCLVFSEEDGLHVISSVCTHLGCVVAYSADGIRCPCHGSLFDTGGRVTGGPAPRDLPWLEVTQGPDGSLFVDAAREVARGTKYRFDV